jgi:integrase
MQHDRELKMSVRKRKWLTTSGEEREAWLVVIGSGDERETKTFQTEKEASAYAASKTTAKAEGVYVSPRKSPTVAKAGESWIAACEAEGLECSTIKSYREQLRLHIIPFIGDVKLCDLSAPAVERFRERLRANGRSPIVTSVVLRCLGSIFNTAIRRGEASKNPCRDVQKRKRSDRTERKPEVGVDIPSPQEVGKIIAAASGRARPLIIVAAFTGLRASELRGLTWGDVDLNANKLKVTQRADRFNEIGNTKSAASRREVPFGTFVANTLKEWKLATRFKADNDFVFATAAGKPDNHANIVTRGFARAITAALGERKYTGLHCLRHFYASWCISRGLPPKVIQTRLGHSTIAMMFDTYGHLFPGADDAAEIEAAEWAVISAS